MLRKFCAPVNTAAKKGSADTYDIGLALSDGSFMVVRPQMSGQGLGDERVYSLSVEYPYGEEPLKIAAFLFLIQRSGLNFKGKQ